MNIRTSKRLVWNLKQGQPVFVLEGNSIATVIDRFVEPNGSIVYKTDEGMRDAELLIPIHFEKNLRNFVEMVGISPSVEAKVRNWFNY